MVIYISRRDYAVLSLRRSGLGRAHFNNAFGLVLFIGVNLIAHPLRGLISITYAVAVVMMIVGIVRLVLAFSDELRPFRLIMVISGALSIILAMMIFSNFPRSAAVVLGVYLAIELISNGVALIAIALARKSETSAEV